VQDTILIANLNPVEELVKLGGAKIILGTDPGGKGHEFSIG
jgi:hypothetical protein